MTFLAPGFLFAALAALAGIVALHFIVTRQPRAAVLPTARFVPDTRATTVAPAPRPSDLRLMFLRVLIVLAAGAGLARPVLKPSRAAEARVILIDVSRSARDSTAIRDSVRSIYRTHDAVVVFDSAARLLAGNVADSIGAFRPTDRRGNLSAALIAALRAGSSLQSRADSIELVIVSPFAREELDAATDSIRQLWPGKARLVRVAMPVPDTSGSSGRLEARADPNDPLAVTASLVRGVSRNAALIDRRELQPVSSPADGRALIEWPASTRPRFAVRRAVRDTIGGVMAGDAIVVAAFDRQWSFPPDSLRGAEVIARWADGDPAAIERPDGFGCARSVAIPVTPVGDLVIRHDFVRLVAALSGPCAGATSLIPADPDAVAKLAGNGGLASREAFQPLTDVRSDLAPWFFALALAAAIVELFVRRRARNAKEARDSMSAPNEARAA